MIAYAKRQNVIIKYAKRKCQGVAQGNVKCQTTVILRNGTTWNGTTLKVTFDTPYCGTWCMANGACDVCLCDIEITFLK